MPGGAAHRDAPECTFPAIPAARRRRRALGTGLVALGSSFLGALVGGALILVAVGPFDDEAEVVVESVQAPDPPVPTGPGHEAGEVDRVAVVAEAVLPSVVRVDVDGGPGVLEASGNGSGLVYRSDGMIVTNNHVVEAADGLSVLFADGSREEADVVGTDPLNDLAVIQVDRDELPVIPAADRQALRVGELAVAVGSPFGLEGSVTSGVVSALDRGIDVRGPGGAALTLPEVVQTDAPINPGNSGGPLVDGQGRLIGINSAILTSGERANAGVGFAIPVDVVVDVADELIDQGFVRHPFIGIQGQTIPPDEAADLGIDGGARVAEVLEGTPAGDAGLAAGDVVIGLGEDDILTMEELVTNVLGYDVGDVVEVRYLRDGEEHAVDVELGERPQEVDVDPIPPDGGPEPEGSQAPPSVVPSRTLGPVEASGRTPEAGTR